MWEHERFERATNRFDEKSNLLDLSHAVFGHHLQKKLFLAIREPLHTLIQQLEK